MDDAGVADAALDPAAVSLDDAVDLEAVERDGAEPAAAVRGSDAADTVRDAASRLAGTAPVRDGAAAARGVVRENLDEPTFMGMFICVWLEFQHT